MQPRVATQLLKQRSEKNSLPLEKAQWDCSRSSSRAQKVWSWTRDFSPAKERELITYCRWARWEVQQYVRSLRKAGTRVNARIVIAAAEEITRRLTAQCWLKRWSHLAYTGLGILIALKDGILTAEDSASCHKNQAFSIKVKVWVGKEIPPEESQEGSYRC